MSLLSNSVIKSIEHVLNKKVKIIQGNITEINLDNYSCTMIVGDNVYKNVELNTYHFNEIEDTYKSIIIIPKTGTFAVAVSYDEDLNINLLSCKEIDKILIGNNENDFILTIDITNNIINLKNGENLEINIDNESITINNDNSDISIINDKITMNSNTIEINGNGEFAVLGETISSAIGDGLGYLSDFLGSYVTHTHIDPVSGTTSPPSDAISMGLKKTQVDSLKSQESNWVSDKTKLE